jgi:hypothetical protein
MTAIAVGVSLVSLYFSWDAKKLAHLQEKRRSPKLMPSLVQSYVRSSVHPNVHVYAFHLSVSNPTDADNAVSAIDFHLTYVDETGTVTTVKIRAQQTDVANFLSDSASHLASPTRVAAHDTVSGWCYFQIDSDLLRGKNIERHEIVLTDSQGERSSVEPIMIREFRDGP